MNTERKKRHKIASLNQDEDHLEEHENNETQEPPAIEKVTEEASVDVRTMVKEDRAPVVPEKHNKESMMNLEKYLEDFGTIDEELEAAAVTDQQNEEAIGDLQDITKSTNNENV